jgi:hypothetical protein
MWSGIADSQLPVNRAPAYTVRKIAVNDNATIRPLSAHRRPGATIVIASAPSAGHIATHSIHPMHSAERICTSRSTGRWLGHTFAHFPQSMHATASRLTRSGLNTAARPISAPYGHRYRHHAFGMKMDATINTPRNTAAPPVRYRKKFSIFTSATNPYGDRRKSPIDLASIVTTAYRNAASNRYFNDRSGISSHFGAKNDRRNVSRPSFHNHSENAPTGHSHPQNAFRNTSDKPRNVRIRTIAAGWTEGIEPVSRKYFVLINPAIGSHPSTPGGRAGVHPFQRPSYAHTNNKNSTPIHKFNRRNAACRPLRQYCESSGPTLFFHDFRPISIP